MTGARGSLQHCAPPESWEALPARVREAYERADAAAAASGIHLRDADPDDIPAVLGLFERTWGVGRGPNRSMIQALDHAGSTVLLATDSSGPVGATLGFLGWDDGLHLHSHLNAVAPRRRSGGVGYALKLLQRALCLEHDVTEMRWTYDPLIRRNAYFNLVKLGAEVVRFLPDFYGRLDDAITGSDSSDRFEVRWRLESPRTRRALARGPVPDWSASLRLELAADYESLRTDAAEEAARLRALSRDAFATAQLRGLRPELDGAGSGYVFTADDPDEE